MEETMEQNIQRLLREKAIFSYDKLCKHLKLNREEKYTDEVLLNSSLAHIKNFIKYDPKLMEHQEFAIIKHFEIKPENTRCNHVNYIFDYDTNKKINKHKYVFEETQHTIKFLTAELEGHRVVVNYNTGYTEETLPADLQEAIIKLFLFKKWNLNRAQEISEEELYDTNFSLPAEVKETLLNYRGVLI